MNNVQLMGRLVRDPMVSYTESENVVVAFTLAVNRPYKAKDGSVKVDFIPCICWGKKAELIGNTIKKGQRILVNQGTWHTRTYDDNGTRHYVNECLILNFEYIEKKDHEEPKHVQAFGNMEEIAEIDF